MRVSGQAGCLPRFDYRYNIPPLFNLRRGYDYRTKRRLYVTLVKNSIGSRFVRFCAGL